MLLSFSDLNISNSPILFDGSHSRNCIDLIIINDAEPEGNENVVLNLVPVFMSKPFCLTVEPSFLTLQIEDDDGKCNNSKVVMIASNQFFSFPPFLNK